MDTFMAPVIQKGRGFHVVTVRGNIEQNSAAWKMNYFEIAVRLLRLLLGAIEQHCRLVIKSVAVPGLVIAGVFDLNDIHRLNPQYFHNASIEVGP